MPETRTIETRGGAVAFEVRAAGHGAPLVYFHSYYERSAWAPFLDLLARSFSVWAPSHPGVAGSTGVETLEDLLDLTLAYDELLTALGVERAHLVGHSFGGMAAAELAAGFSSRAPSPTPVSPPPLRRARAPPLPSGSRAAPARRRPSLCSCPPMSWRPSSGAIPPRASPWSGPSAWAAATPTTSPRRSSHSSAARRWRSSCGRSPTRGSAVVCTGSPLRRCSCGATRTAPTPSCTPRSGSGGSRAPRCVCCRAATWFCTRRRRLPRAQSQSSPGCDARRRQRVRQRRGLGDRARDRPGARVPGRGSGRDGSL